MVKQNVGEQQVGSQIREVSWDTPGSVCQEHSCSPGSLENPSLEQCRGWILLSKFLLLISPCSSPACSALKGAKALWLCLDSHWDHSKVREDQGHGMILNPPCGMGMDFLMPCHGCDSACASLALQQCELSATGALWPPPCRGFGSVQGTPGPWWVRAGSLLSVCLPRGV